MSQMGEVVPSVCGHGTPESRGREVAQVRQLLFESGRLLFAGSDPDVVLHRIAQGVCEALGYGRCLIAAIDGGLSGRVRGRAGYGLRLSDVREVGELLHDVPVLRQSLEDGRPLVLPPEHVRSAIPPRYMELFALNGTLVLVPLLDSRLGPLGMMFLDRPGHRFVPPASNLAALADFGEIATLAVQNAALLEDRARLVAMLERSRLAVELHDGVTQRLFSVALTLEELADLPELPEGARPLLARALRDVESGSSQLRRALTELARDEPAAAGRERQSFEGRLRRIVEDFSDAAGIGADIDVRGSGSGSGSAPGPDAQDVLLRTARESLANVLKHSGATQVTVLLRRGEHHWVLEVHDDGQGRADVIRRAARHEEGHFGLRSLRNDGLQGQGRLWISQSPTLGGLQVTMSVESSP